jgi:hypothetical protein
MIGAAGHLHWPLCNGVEYSGGGKCGHDGPSSIYIAKMRANLIGLERDSRPTSKIYSRL